MIPTSIASSAAFETLNDACGGKFDKDTLLVQVAGYGVRITEDGKNAKSRAAINLDFSTA
jgi:hypothetical protein